MKPRTRISPLECREHIHQHPARVVRAVENHKDDALYDCVIHYAILRHGILSIAIVDYRDWRKLDIIEYLVDAFQDEVSGALVKGALVWSSMHASATYVKQCSVRVKKII